MNRSYRTPTRRPNCIHNAPDGKMFADYKDIDDLRRLMTPNGKIYSRKRSGVTAKQQRMIASAIKRARYMALLPYTSATL